MIFSLCPKDISRHVDDMSPTCRRVFDDMTFSLCPKESADMSADVVPTQHVVSSGMVRTAEFDDVSGRHSRHFPDMSACRRTTCRLGGSGDTTRRRHFQLSQPWNCFQTTTNLLSDPRVLHIPVFISNFVSFVFFQIDPISTHKNHSPN